MEILSYNWLTIKEERVLIYEKNGKILQFSRRVEITGVEPVTFCMPCKRSSQLS